MSTPTAADWTARNAALTAALTPPTFATRTGRQVTASRDGDTFTLTTTKPFLIVWRRDGELKASASASAKAAEAGAKLIARNAGDTDIEVVEVR